MARDNAWLDKTARYEPLLVECGLDDLTLQFDRQIHYRILHRGFTVDVFAYLRPGSKKLVLSGQDAVQRQRDQLPYFYRWSWHREIEASFITLNDPTLYMGDSLDAGWYQGYREAWAIDAIHEVLSRFAELLAVESKDILLYGISAGGFWALMSCVGFPGSKVMVEIPQVDLFAYSDGGPKERMFQRCFRGRSEDYIRTRYSSRLRVIDRWRDSSTLPSRVLYCQNIKDYSHTRTQMEPFWDELQVIAQEDERFRAMQVEFRMFNRKTPKGGHVPMERHDTIAVWRELLAED